MEPRSDERGRPVWQVVGVVVHGASMEPRSDERGRLSPQGRAFVEEMLQWSRVRMNAEGHQRAGRTFAIGFASMEPRSDERGRACAATTTNRTVSCFNGAAFG